MRKNLVFIFISLYTATPSLAQQKKWTELLTATDTYLQQHLWNANTHNFVRRADQPSASGSDAWGITIELDALAFMVEVHSMSSEKGQLPESEKLKQYFQFSSALYEKTSGISGARILARQGDRIYIGGDDDMQWCAALVHCYLVTHDDEYLKAATSSFNALVEMGFWQDGSSKGWSWNSADRRPNGVSTAYGALAAARLYKATKENAFKQWVSVSLNALKTPQVGFFPRDMMVAASAAMTAYEVSGETEFKTRAMELEDSAVAGGQALLHHDGAGERNPTDIGDLADGLYYFYKVTRNAKYKKLADTFISFFVGRRTTEDIMQHGFYSRYDTKGAPILSGSYLGVPCSVAFLPEVAEMQKLFAIGLK